MIEGVDYSRTANGDWNALAATLKANGKKFVGRYAVNDLAPNGRGITADEYAAMKAAGIAVYLYWESSEGWMMDGFAAGAQAAVNAQQNINRAGMPHDTPVYFACDFDAAPSQQWAIDKCLEGAATVIGFDRVGVYGGYHVIHRCHENGTAKWFSQTSAWSGGMLHPAAHIYQYEYNQYFAGTNCDLNRAFAENFGQAMDAPVEPEKPKYATPLPITWKEGDYGWKQLNKTPVFALEAEVECVRATTPLAWADGDRSDGDVAPAAGPKLKQGERVKIIGSFAGKNAKGKTVRWLIRSGDNARLVGNSFRPLLPVTQ